MIKALIFDIDETLIRAGKTKVEDSALFAIHEAKKKGIKIIVATGRGYSFMHPDVKQRVNADYYVTINGTCIASNDGTPIRTVPMGNDDLNRLMEICDEKKYLYGIKCSKAFITYNHHKEYCKLYCDDAITEDMVEDKSNQKDYHLKDDVALGVFLFSENNEAMNLQKEFPDLKFYPFLNVGCECCSRYMNKGKALKELMESLNISLDECMAFGDSNNDVDMIQMCGIGVAMGNGNDNAKAAADYVTTDADKDGIYNALKHFEII